MVGGDDGAARKTDPLNEGFIANESEDNFEDSETKYLERYILKVHHTSKESGRQQQQLTCLICRQNKSPRRSNILEHIKTHFKTKPF